MTGSYVIWPYDCVDAMLHLMDAESVHCAVTSPPYYRKRDYQCDGQLGHEATPQEYVARLVQVARGIRRVLRPDGTLWLNLGDTYANDDKWGGATGGKAVKALHGGGIKRQKNVSGIAPKNLIGIPWRVAFALQDDGWHLRQAIIWRKKNPMPESARDRFTSSYETIFLLARGPRYFFDQDAVREPAIYAARGRISAVQGSLGGKGPIPGSGQSSFRAIRDMRNKRDVWDVSTQPFKGAHFATFPPDLIEPCILAGCPVGGTVLDPFGGSGTTALVALRHGRNAVLCELNPGYVEMAHARIAGGK